MDEEPVSSNDLYLSLHGTLITLITALHREGRLPEGFFQQMRLSSQVLVDEGAPDAARMMDMIAQTLTDEFQASKPYSG